jgi:mannosidase alpha-like ER degradation enhancer 2
MCPLVRSYFYYVRVFAISLFNQGVWVFREEVRQMFQHAYDGYLKYAYPYDELRPLSCDGVDTWGR